ncbi:MAG: hypothetical protein Q7S06_03420 [Nanoarchaeota archaeon]|nr:hypothetical protein [Nanoarchaeota archaeon]
MGLGEVINNTGLFKNVDIKVLLPRGLISIGIILFGIVIGKLVTSGLKKLFMKIELEKKVKKSLTDLFLIIIRWSIYIIFFSLGLNYLDISNLTKNITNILITIPTFVGALILILLGFSVAYFLKKVILTTEIKGVEIVSEVVFYFVVYITGVYAIKTALIPLGEQITNYLIMILTGVFGGAGAYLLVKKFSK